METTSDLIAALRRATTLSADERVALRNRAMARLQTLRDTRSLPGRDRDILRLEHALSEGRPAAGDNHAP